MLTAKYPLTHRCCPQIPHSSNAEVLAATSVTSSPSGTELTSIALSKDRLISVVKSNRVQHTRLGAIRPDSVEMPSTLIPPERFRFVTVMAVTISVLMTV